MPYCYFVVNDIEDNFFMIVYTNSHSSRISTKYQGHTSAKVYIILCLIKIE